MDFCSILVIMQSCWSKMPVDVARLIPNFVAKTVHNQNALVSLPVR